MKGKWWGGVEWGGGGKIFKTQNLPSHTMFFQSLEVILYGNTLRLTFNPLS